MVPPPPRGNKRPPPGDLPPPPPQVRRREEPRGRRGPPRFVGSIISYEQSKGYGFIECPNVPEGDIYFRRSDLPPDAQGMQRRALQGQLVEFSPFMTPDGKPRAEDLRVLGSQRRGSMPPMPPDGPRGGDMRPPPPMDEQVIADMTRFLEGHGGASEYGAFTRKFRGYKKSQLEPHFNLTPEGEDAGGRWQISLQGIDPPPLPERRPQPKHEPKEQVEEVEEVEEAGDEQDLGRQLAVISFWDGVKGYGFAKSEEVTQGDIHFKRSELPQEVQQYRRTRLVGAAVEMDCKLTARGRPRGLKISILDLPPEPEPGQAAENSERPEKRERQEKNAGPPPPALPAEQLAEMREFLVEAGGSMDYGKFSNAFAGIKKAQLEDHFQLVPDNSDNSGGRWQILLPGADFKPRDDMPPPLDEAPRRERGVRGGRERGAPRQRGPIFEPSPGMWLVGFIRKWDDLKNFGFIAADGTDDIFVHRDNMPPELQDYRGDMHGVELTFELTQTHQGKLRVASVRALLAPDGRGGWQLRRV